MIGFLGAYFFQNNFSRAQNRIQSPTNSSENLQTAVSPTPHVESPGKPLKINIPSLSVAAEVESVSEDSVGRMDIPNDYMNAAWYELGAIPGELGNSVIAAHYDTPTGDPSVFYEIDTLKQGDEIVVTDENGTDLVFLVTQVVTYKNDNFPIKTVFGSHDKKRLNLITCGGDFDSTLKDYSDRTVVFSEFFEIRKVQNEI